MTNINKNKLVRCGECKFAKEIYLNPRTGMRRYICECTKSPIEIREGAKTLSGGDMCEAGEKIEEIKRRSVFDAGSLYDNAT